MFYRKWTMDAIVGHIIGRHPQKKVNSSHYAAHYPDVHAAGVRLFGTWREAIEAAGLDYEEVCVYRRWSKGKVTATIKEMRKSGGAVNSKHAQDNCRPLYLAALRRFGSWNNALEAAGINAHKVMLRRRRKKSELKECVLALHAKGASLAYTDMRKHHSWLLAAASRRIGGGSWLKARKVCGIR